MNIPSIKTIKTRLTGLDKVGDPDELAKQIRKELEVLRHYPQFDGPPYDPLLKCFQKLDKLLNTHGVDYIRRKDDGMYRVNGIEYLNTGDTYIPTICYNHATGTIQICSWGDIVERNMTAYE